MSQHCDGVAGRPLWVRPRNRAGGQGRLGATPRFAGERKRSDSRRRKPPCYSLVLIHGGPNGSFFSPEVKNFLCSLRPGRDRRGGQHLRAPSLSFLQTRAEAERRLAGGQHHHVQPRQEQHGGRLQRHGPGRAGVRVPFLREQSGQQGEDGHLQPAALHSVPHRHPQLQPRGGEAGLQRLQLRVCEDHACRYGAIQPPGPGSLAGSSVSGLPISGREPICGPPGSQQPGAWGPVRRDVPAAQAVSLSGLRVPTFLEETGPL